MHPHFTSHLEVGMDNVVDVKVQHAFGHISRRLEDRDVVQALVCGSVEGMWRGSSGPGL